MAASDQLFAFEQDFVTSLRCIPMAVRLKLDRSGVKVSLRQWSRFTREERQALLLLPCDTVAEVDAYRVRLVELIALRSREPATFLPEPPPALWERAEAPPAIVVTHARSVGVAPPTPGEWGALTELQRFVLIKLTRDSHDNVNFVPAMREFGLG